MAIHFHQTREHVIHGTEHNHCEECVSTVVRVPYCKMCKVSDDVNFTKRHCRTKCTRQSVRHSTENNEAQCRASPDLLKAAYNSKVVINSRNNDGITIITLATIPAETSQMGIGTANNVVHASPIIKQS